MKVQDDSHSFNGALGRQAETKEGNQRILRQNSKAKRMSMLYAWVDGAIHVSLQAIHAWITR